MRVTRLCSVSNCGRPVHGHGLCGMHLQRLKAHGDASVKLQPVSKLRDFLRRAVHEYEDDACLIWPFGRNRSGYGVATLDGEFMYIHRQVCLQRHGPAPTEEHIAAHACGRGHEGCCNYRHLRWATRTENEADKWLHGTQGRKLTLADVLEIRALAGTMRRPDLARRYGVTTATIKHVVERRTWTKAA